MRIWDYIKPFEIFNRSNNNYIPVDIISYIYSFIIDEIKEDITKYYINKSITHHLRQNTNIYGRSSDINSYTVYFSSYTVHFDTIPYFKMNNNNRIKMKNYILNEFKRIFEFQDKYWRDCGINHCRSDYICKGKGMVINKFHGTYYQLETI